MAIDIEGENNGSKSGFLFPHLMVSHDPSVGTMEMLPEMGFASKQALYGLGTEESLAYVTAHYIRSEGNIADSLITETESSTLSEEEQLGDLDKFEIIGTFARKLVSKIQEPDPKLLKELDKRIADLL